MNVSTVYEMLQAYVNDPTSVTEEQVSEAHTYMRSIKPSKPRIYLIGALMSIQADAGGNVPTLLHKYDTES